MNSFLSEGCVFYTILPKEEHIFEFSIISVFIMWTFFFSFKFDRISERVFRLVFSRWLSFVSLLLIGYFFSRGFEHSFCVFSLIGGWDIVVLVMRESRDKPGVKKFRFVSIRLYMYG